MSKGRVGLFLALVTIVAGAGCAGDAAPGAGTSADDEAPATARAGGGNEDPADPRWDAYHTAAEANRTLEAWAERFPALTELYSIGETLQGSPLMVIEITNEATGPAADKPAYYYDGNIHAGELTAAEVALYFAHYLLMGYGGDERVTELLDTRAVYIRPKFNPDGADIALTSPQTLRSTPRPYDQDMDGLLDEDPPDDLDGDGHITRMRVPDPEGDWYVSPDDPRLMLRRPGDDGGDGPAAGTQFYDLSSEGIDNDNDGRRNEDGIGGIDMNRNFPRNWGMEFEQNGAGPFPLSEPETRATIEFLHAHRNITGVFHGHTSGGFVYRLPSTIAWDTFPPADQELILEQASMYEQTTEQPARPSYTNPEVHRHGTLISWAYWDFGVVGFVPEFWGGMGIDYDEDGAISELERLRYHDEELTHDYFTEWAPFDHPELGSVEIGGWHSKFVNQNPPTELLQREIERYVPWMLWLAEITPRIEIRDVTVTPVEGTEATFRVRVEVENVGYLPTNITQRALDAEIAVPVRAIVEPVGAELLDGNGRIDIGHLAGSRGGGGPGAPASRTGSAEFLVVGSAANATLELSVVSERGGTVRRTVPLR